MCKRENVSFFSSSTVLDVRAKRLQQHVVHRVHVFPSELLAADPLGMLLCCPCLQRSENT